MRPGDLRAMWEQMAEAAKGPQDPSRADAIEESLSDLWRERYSAEDVRLSEASKDEAVAMLSAAMRERNPREAQVHKNGHAPKELRPGLQAFTRPMHVRSNRWVWAGLVFAAVLVVVALLDLPSQLRPGAQVRGDELPKTGTRRTTPEDKLLPQQKAPFVNNQKNEGKGVNLAAKPPLEPEPNHRRKTGVVAQRGEVGKFTSVMGEPRVTLIGEKASRKALPKVPVTIAMRIETGDADKAQIKFKDGTIVSLDFNTAVVMGESGSEALSLDQGRLWAMVAHHDEYSPFAVTTPTATAVALGTEFGLDVTPRSKEAPARTKLTVQKGRVKFFNGQGSVEAGPTMESVATDDDGPSEPKRVVSFLNALTELGDFSYEVGFARPDPLDLLDRLDARLGSIGASLRQTPEGDTWVIAVAPNGPAAKAGLLPGSRVVAVDGEPVRKLQELLASIGERIGHEFHFVVEKDRQLGEFAVKSEFRRVDGVAYRRLKETERSTALLMRGRTAEGKKLLEAQAKNTSNAAIANNLGIACEMDEELGRAVRQYGAAVKLEPGKALYRLNLGLALRSIGNLERAIEELQEATRLEPQSAEARIALAECLSVSARTDEALQCLDEAPRGQSWLDAKIAVEKSVLYSRTKRDALAEQAAEQALSLDSSAFQTWTQWSTTLFVKGDYRGAEAAARTAISLNPTSGAAFDALANAISDNRNNPYRFREADEAASRADELGLRDSQLFSASQAGLNFAFGYTARAEKLFAQARRDGAANIGWYVGAAYTLMHRGKFAEAETILHEGIEKWPRDPVLPFVMAGLRQLEGNWDESEALSLHALDLDPHWTWVMHGLADLYAKTNRPALAEPLWRRMIVDSPHYAWGYLGLATLLKAQGRMQEAEAICRQWTDTKNFGMSGDYEYYVGVLYDPNWVGSDERARADWASDPTSEGKLLAYCGALDAHGRIGEAIRVSKEFLKSQPANLNVRQNLINLLIKAGGNLDEALAVAKAHFDAYSSSWRFTPLAEILVRRGSLAEVDRIYRTAFGGSKEPLGSLKALASAYIRGGTATARSTVFKHGVELYRRAISIDPTSDSAIELAKFLQDGGCAPLAAEVLRKELARRPKDQRVLLTLAGYGTWWGGDIDEALDLARRAVANEPSDRHARCVLAGILIKRAELDEAELILRKAAAEAPTAEASELLGRLCEIRNNPAEALEHYRRAVESEPWRKFALEGFDRLSKGNPPPTK